jgi:hypothetical protein
MSAVESIVAALCLMMELATFYTDHDHSSRRIESELVEHLDLLEQGFHRFRSVSQVRAYTTLSQTDSLASFQSYQSIAAFNASLLRFRCLAV